MLLYHKVLLNALGFKGVVACAVQHICECCTALKIFFSACAGIHM